MEEFPFNFINSRRPLLQNDKEKFKTVICNNWLKGHCEFGDSCKFAHGSEDLRNSQIKSSTKTKQCKQFHEKGFCQYGLRCQFVHRNTSQETAANSPAPQEKFVLQGKDRKRLPVFKKLSSQDA